ncbi:hypothetical protein [Mesorhizobium sp.]|nr:hypothetical protein [Mesorhizobium sp.]TJV50883.1 MAG: hypothetical protein E5Y01_17600 [Mesorhizobium sp.]
MSWTDLQIYVFCLIGVFISVVLPVLWAYIRQFFPANAGQKSLPDGLIALVKPYAALGLASALTAIVLIILLKDTLTDARAAFLAGYAWDSTLQKLR